MALKSLRFISIICAALVLGQTVSHVLEIPGKRHLSAEEWLTVQHHFYGGYAIVGGISEILGLIVMIVILCLTWKNRKTFLLTLASTLSFVGLLLSFWFGNRPINFKIAQWTSTTMPENWEVYRDQWDFAHSVSAVLVAIAFITLLVSVFRNET